MIRARTTPEGGLGQPCYPDDTCDAPYECDGGVCTPGDDEFACEPGQIVSCHCPDGEEGVAQCLADGASHSPCECGADLECHESDLSSQGSMATSVAPVDFSNAIVEVTARHKIDVDEFEDGCVGEVKLVLHHQDFGTDRGCRLELEFGGVIAADSYWYGGLRRVEFEADEFCPDFPDATEGTYHSAEASMMPIWYEGPRMVPDRTADFSCVGEVGFSFPDTTFVLDADGDRTLEVNLGDLEVSGMLFSEGDGTLRCVEPDCPGPEYVVGDDGWCAVCVPDCTGIECGPDPVCGESCGTCEAVYECNAGACECVACEECGPGYVCDDGTIFAGNYNGFAYYTTPEDLGEYCWNNCGNENIDTDTPDLDDGWGNTVRLALHLDIGTGSPYQAAEACWHLEAHGRTDWFLPARNELRQVLYENRDAIGAFTTDYYWSSSARSDDPDYAWLLTFWGGSPVHGYKGSSHHIRCVRGDAGP